MRPLTPEFVASPNPKPMCFSARARLRRTSFQSVGLFARTFTLLLIVSVPTSPAKDLLLNGFDGIRTARGRATWSGESAPWNPLRQPIEIAVFIIGLQALLIVAILLERRSHKQKHKTLARRLALEQQIYEISKRLAASSENEIDDESQRGLERIRMLLAADRICWYSNQPGSSTFERFYCAVRKGVPHPPVSVRREDVPSVMDLLLSGIPVCVNSLSDLPRAAVRERQFFEELGVRSLVLIPSNAGPSTHGLLTLSSVTTEQSWNTDLLRQLGVLANVIASTLQRKQAQRASQESEQRFRRIFEDSPLGIALENFDGELLLVNSALCSMLGYSEEELRKMSCADFTHPEDIRAEAVLFEELRTGQRASYHLEKRFLRKNSSQLWTWVSVSLLKSAGSRSPLVIGMVANVTESRATEDKLKTAQVQLQQLTAHLIQAQDDERRRISRELHDDFGQRLSLLSIELDTLRNGLSASGQRRESQRVSQIMQQTDELSTDIHELCHRLHSSKLQHLGLRSALRELCQRLSEQQGMSVDLQIDCLEELMDPELALCLYRVAQEALNNVAKHSQAKEASVQASFTQGVLRLRVRDPGVGFTVEENLKGMGLASMRERLRIINGELIVKSHPGEGTEITAVVFPERRQAAAASKT